MPVIALVRHLVQRSRFREALAQVEAERKALATAEGAKSISEQRGNLEGSSGIASP